MKSRVLKVHEKDNVLVALQHLKAGETISYGDESYLLPEDVDAKHKFYTEDLPAGSAVIMYGTLVGKTQSDVKRGQRMTVDNLKHAAAPYAYRPYHYHWQPPDVLRFAGRTFNGYYRSDGRVGTAN